MLSSVSSSSMMLLKNADLDPCLSHPESLALPPMAVSASTQIQEVGEGELLFGH